LGLHRRAALTVTGRETLVRRVLVDGWPACHAAAAMAVSRATAYKWIARFKAEGRAGLVDRSSRPHHTPRALAKEQVERILAVRRQRRWGPHQLSAALRLPRSTIYAVLVRQGCARLTDFDRLTGKPLRYVRERPGELLHIDIKKLGRIPPGGGHRLLGDHARRGGGNGHPRIGYDYLHVAVDDASRLAYVRVMPDESSTSTAAFLRDARTYYARHRIRLERVITDCGRAYCSVRFRAAARELGIVHKTTRPRRPQTNGKAERFIQTLLKEWAYARLFRSNDQRRDTLPRWLYFYNSRRPHTALGGRSPLDVVNNVSGNNS
jgi:transposase InsO family protein